MNPHLNHLALVPEILEFEEIGGSKGFIAKLARDKGEKSNTVPGCFQAEDNILHHRQVPGHRPELPPGVDDRAAQDTVLNLGLAGGEVEILHIRQIERRPAH